MGNVSSDALLYVKEDLIIPQDISFYDLIATRARGKSGPLFNFDVHDDVRLGAVDARVEKDESHPGKGTSMQYEVIMTCAFASNNMPLFLTLPR